MPSFFAMLMRPRVNQTLPGAYLPIWATEKMAIDLMSGISASSA
jgi:hypothetical protein